MYNIASLAINMEELKKTIANAKEWFMHSGIQNLDSGSLEVKGGFNVWFDREKSSYFYTYSEITGYAITKLLALYTTEKNYLYLSRAVLAAEWLLDKAAHKSGGIKTRYFFNKEDTQDLYDFSSGVVHSFDNGMALNGLMDLFKLTKEKRYLIAAQKIGNLLTDIMQKEDGSMYASYSHKDEAFKDSDEKWSSQAGSFEVKVCSGLLKLYEATKDEKYKEATIKLCDYTLNLQKENGRFISFKKEEDTHLHPHCYSAEGLLFAGLYLGKDTYVKAARNAVQWALDQQLENGGIPSMFVSERKVEVERSDVLAQTIRLGIIMRSLKLLDEKYEEKIDKAVKRLITFQCTNGDQRSSGGFLYGHDIDYRNELRSTEKNHVNTWCTMFAMQALNYYADYKEGKFVFDKEFIV